jgi:EthD domain
MYKLAAAIRFKQDIAGDEARRYWLDVHGPMTAAIAPVLVYAQNHVVGRAAFDGYACQWFADRAACDATVATAPWHAVVDDGAVFQDTGWTMAAAVEEHVLVDGHRAPFKVVAVATLGDGRARDTWLDGMARRVGELPPVVRYVQNVAIAPTVHAGRDGAFDVIAELYFESQATYVATTQTKGWRALAADLAARRAWTAVVAEHVVKDQAVRG